MRKLRETFNGPASLAEPENPMIPRMGAELNAVITGASSGIGRAIAAAIASRGAAVCLVGRNAERLEAVAGKARLTARLVLVCEADLTIDSAVDELARRLKHEFDALDILVHSAGAFATGKIEATPVEQLDALYRANLRLPFALTQALLPLLKVRPGRLYSSTLHKD